MTHAPNLNQAKVVVVVFTLEGCGACDEFKPRFRQIASHYAHAIPIVMADANDPRYAQLADRLSVQSVPATYILRKPHGIMRAVGGLPDEQINRLLDFAVREAAAYY